MRAFVVTFKNMIYSDNDDLPFNDEKKQYIATTVKDKPVLAAFDNLDDAMNGIYSVLNDLMEDFEEYNYFEDKGSRISLNVDVVEMTEDEFNEISSNNPTTGKFAILSIPHELK